VVARIRQFLAIDPVELPLVQAFLLHSFLMGLTVTFFETAAYSTFLTRYTDASNILPIAYISASVLTVGMGLIYNQVEKRVSFRRLMTLNLLTVFVALLSLRGLFFVTDAPFPALLGVMAFDLLWVLQSLEFWGLAGHVFTVRQAKRLFGVIGAGEVMAMIVGGALIPLFLRFLHTLDLYFIAAAASIASLLVMRWIVTHSAKAEAAQTTQPDSGEEEERRSVREMTRDRYLLLTFVLAAVTIFTLYYIDNAFYKAAEQRYTNPDDLSAFLATFFFIVGFVQLFVRAVLSGALLKRFGVFGGLLVMPVLLVFGIVVTLAGSAMPQAALLAFSGIILVKLFDRALRYSLNRTSLLILYQPLSRQERLRAQTAVEMYIEPIGGVLSGASLLLLNQVFHVEMQVLLLITLVVVAIWLLTAIIIRSAYTQALLRALRRRLLSQVDLDFTDSTSLEILRQTRYSPNAGEVIYGLNVLVRMQHPELDEFVIELLHHSDSAVRLSALQTLDQENRKAALPALLKQMVVETEPTLQRDMLRIAARMGAAEQVTPYLEHENSIVQSGAMVGLLSLEDEQLQAQARQKLFGYAASPVTDDRVFAAMLLSGAPLAHRNAPRVLEALLLDEEGPVRREAVIAAAKLHYAPVLPIIVNNLEIGYNGLAASMEALIQAGPDALPHLFKAFDKPNQTRYVQLRLIRVIRRIGGDGVANWLRDHLRHPESLVRYELLRTLREMPQKTGSLDMALLDEQIGLEVREAAGQLAALLDVQADTRFSLMLDALQNDLHLTKERLLLLLSFRYDTPAFLTVQSNIDSKSPQKRAYALEILESLLTKDWRGIVLALFEPEELADQYEAVSVYEPQRRMSPLDRLRSFVTETRSIPPWTLACTYYLLSDLGTRQDSAAIGQAMNSLTDMIVRETAMVALYRLNPTLYTIFQASMEDVQQQGETLLAQRTMATRRSIARETEGQGKMLLLIEKVLILRGVSLFADVSEDFLSEVAFHLQEVDHPSGQTFIWRGDPGNALYIIATGRVRVHEGETVYATLGAREVVGELALLDSEPRTADVTTLEPTKLLRLPQDVFFELLGSNPEMMRGILKIVTQRLRGALSRIS
jgi:ATP:ADP antiporter, AAA family